MADRYCIAERMFKRSKTKTMYKDSDVTAAELRKVGLEVFAEDLTDTEAIALLTLLNGGSYD